MPRTPCPARRPGPQGLALLAILCLCAGCCLTCDSNVPPIPMVACDGSGGALVALVRDWEIQVARLGSDGKAAWQVLLPGARTKTAQLLEDGSGGAIVVWTDSRTGDGEHIYAQRVSAAGELLWADEGAPVCIAPGRQVLRGLAGDGAGGAFIFWLDMQSLPYGLYMQRIDAAGTLAFTPDGVLLATTTGYGAACAVSDGAGGALVAWQGGAGLADDPRTLSLQHVDSHGLPLWEGNGIVLATGEDVTGSSLPPRVTPDGAGGAVLAWRDDRQGLRAQRVDAQGHGLWQSVVLSSGGVATTSALLAGGQGGFLMAWGEMPGSRLSWQKLDSAGAAQWDSQPLVFGTASGGSIQDVEVVGDGADGAFVAWRVGVGAKSGSVRLQRLDAAGRAVWPDGGLAMCPASGAYQGHPRLAADGAGGVIVAFLMGKSSGRAVPYAQRVDAAGNLLWPKGAVRVYR